VEGRRNTGSSKSFRGIVIYILRSPAALHIPVSGTKTDSIKRDLRAVKGNAPALKDFSALAEGRHSPNRRARPKMILAFVTASVSNWHRLRL